MFTGFFLMWSNVVAVLPLVAVPGYYRVTFDEEAFLVRRFGDVYREYQRKAGRFVPKIR
jgi:protein-S-isoprenylcysteine O-methyltransferase Ste14